jgi:RNA polymerase sigma factor (sigma-70 family)
MPTAVNYSAEDAPSASTQESWVTALLAAHEGALLRYAQRLTGDLETARDVVQDAFLKLCRQDRESVDGHVVEWLYTVCRHAAIDARRKDRRMSTLTDEAIAARADSLSERAPDYSTETSDTAKRVLALLPSLPASQQEVIRLRFQTGLSYKEISGVTGLTVNHVGVLLHNGLKALRDQLQAAPV